MEVIEIKDLEDGGALMTFDATEEEKNLFFRVGLQKLIDDEFEGKCKVVPVDENSNREFKSFEIDDDSFEELVKIGVIKVLTDSAEKVIENFEMKDEGSQEES